MSEAAKSAEEIEDVLASIRRLVAGPVPARNTPEAATAERLVLTPSLRVRDPDDPWARVSPAVHDSEQTAAQAEDAGDRDRAWGLEDRLADWGEIEQSAAEAVADALSQGQGVRIPDQLDRVMFSRKAPAQDAPEPGDLADDLTGDFEPETGDADWPDTGADGALRELFLARGQPDAPQDGAQSLGMAETRDDSAQTPPEPQDAPAGHSPQDAQPLDDAPPASDIGVQDMEDDLTGPADEDLDDDLEDEIEDLGEATAPFVFPDAEVGLLDEDTLREIVADVVRQELQGALGQRITRNVRKMVRREIRLVLAAEDLE